MNRFILAVFLVLSAYSALSAANPSVTIDVNVGLDAKFINPGVYGVSYATTSQLQDLNITLNRLGGNNTSRYNWQLNADNRANDWYFESIGDPSAVAGERGDTFIHDTKAGGAEPMITIPMIGWIAKLGANRSKLCSFSIAKYGAQQANDWQWYPDAGNGVLMNGQYVTGNDPNDANVPNSSLTQLNWMLHLVNQHGAAAAGGLKYYILDNEPSIWHATHRDVNPTGVTMAGIRDLIIDYASKVRLADPTAQIVAPEEWGWSGYFYSGYDQQYGSQHGWGYLPDRAANGNADYLPWLLAQLRSYDLVHGTKSLDVFSLHYYPQGGEYWGGTDTWTQNLRNRSTRSLWDPSYIDETWIDDEVQLIPRMKQWVNTYYPGLKTAITEYSWGADDHINGATAQADILGIFGREGLDMAARWVCPATGSRTYNAFKIYRNYDGLKSAFGSISVRATVPNPDNVSAFASFRPVDGALTVVVISKYLSDNTPMTLNLAGFNPGLQAVRYRLTNSNVINHLSNVNVSSGSLSDSLPAQSITMYIVPADAPMNQSVSEMKLTADGQIVRGVSLPITSSSSGHLYVEQPDRSSGIKIMPVGKVTGLALGKLTSFAGIMRTDGNKERYVEAEVSVAEDINTLAPLEMIPASVGGGDFFYNAGTGAGQKGPGFGLSNTGLLVRTWGTVTSVDAASNSFVLDGRLKCVMESGGALPSLNSYVVVTGISSLEFASPYLSPVVRVRSMDVTVAP